MQEAVEEIGEIRTSITKMDEGIDDLNLKIEILERRLSPVLKPLCEDLGQPDSVQSGVPLLDSINGQLERLSRVIKRIESLSSRISI